MHQALYRKWRPSSFDEVYGQEHITSILKYEVANNKFSHAYLFCGSRGTGKTSCAKILAKAVNCLSPRDGSPCGECEACRAMESGATTDVIEMDAASNNGVDNIRDIRDEVVYSPTNLKYRVYIIDEVHMLSISAFNALLKTLEEPPEHVVFILATTELHKLPSTIISRCQRFDFRRITTEVLKNHLLRVADAEGIELDEAAAIMLAKQAQGGMRDAISLLDLCAGNRKRIDPELVNSTVGKMGRENMLAVVRAVIGRDYETIFSSVDEVVQSSRDIKVFWQDLIAVYRDLLIIKSSKNSAAYLDLTDSESEALLAIAAEFTIERLSYHCSMLRDTLIAMETSNAITRILAELTLVRMCDERLNNSPEAMLTRIANIESNIATGNFVSAVSAEPAAPAQAAPIPAAPQATERPARPSRRPAYSDDDDDEMFRGDAPGANQPSRAPSAPAATVAPKVETPTASAGAQIPASGGTVRVLKPFRSRAEVYEMMTSVNPMLSGFFQCGKWYSDESGRIVLKFPSASDIKNIKQFGGDSLFLKCVSSITGRGYSKDDLIFECEAEKKTDSVIDKILEAAED